MYLNYFKELEKEKNEYKQRLLNLDKIQAMQISKSNKLNVETPPSGSINSFTSNDKGPEYMESSNMSQGYLLTTNIE